MSHKSIPKELLAARSKFKDFNAYYEFCMELVREDNVDDMRELLTIGEDPNIIHSTYTPLIYVAINSNSMKVLELMLQHRISININGYPNKCPLVHALLENKYEAAEMLIKYKADPNYRREHFIRTPIMEILMAPSTNKIRNIKLLIKAKARFSDEYTIPKRFRVHTVFMIALIHSPINIVKLLVSHGCHQSNPLSEEFIENRNTKVKKYLTDPEGYQKDRDDFIKKKNIAHKTMIKTIILKLSIPLVLINYILDYMGNLTQAQIYCYEARLDTYE